MARSRDRDLSDSIIRDGLQMPGVAMSQDNRLTVFEYLHRIGIEKLEVFLYSKIDRAAARSMLDLGYSIPE
jgi:citrate (Re)-synthase